MMNNPTFAFFGGEPLGVPVLKALQQAGLSPELIVCSPDKPVGRKQVLTPPPVKVWAEANNIPVYQPTSYKGDAGEVAEAKLLAAEAEPWDVFIVVAYNFILPQWLLDIPSKGVINVHPSLLPKLRGASPIRSAILHDQPEAVGVSVMLLDAEMDSGPLLAQQKLPISKTEWPLPGPVLDTQLAALSGALLAETIPSYVSGLLTPQEQDHTHATYCGKLHKSDSEVQIDPHNLPHGSAAQKAWHTFNAFSGIGDIYFLHQAKRIKITQAMLQNNVFTPLTVIPEGKQPTPFTTWINQQ